MKHKAYSQPGIFTSYRDDLPITGLALLDLLQAVLSKGAMFRFKARGSSMTPFIRNGDIITVSNISGIELGLIVAFRRPETGQLVVHRIVEKRKDAVYIMGDEISEHSDGWIPIDNLLGRVTRIERNGHNIYLGLGIERYIIAFLSRLRILSSLRIMIAQIRHRN